MRHNVAIQVNGQLRSRTVATDLFLINLLREELGLTGTHQGCDTAQCGACTVLVDGKAVKSCNVLAVQVDGASVQTVEGLSENESTLHPLQQAFGKHHALQCGYCTPGMLMRGVAMAREGVPAEPAAVRQALSGNLCRCTGYQGIVDAICEGLQIMRKDGHAR